MTVGKHVRTIQWDDRVSRWFYYCGEDKAYVRLQDAEGNLVTEPPTEEKQDDGRKRTANGNSE